MLNMKNCGMRINMSRKFTEKNISWFIRDKISRLFGDTPESEKEALAQRVIDLIEQGKQDQELLKALGLD